MKKLIAISVVFALAVGAAFAVDLGGTVNGVINVIHTTFQDGAAVTSGGEFHPARIDGAGESGDGKFGGYVRLDFTHIAFMKNATEAGGEDVAKWADAYAFWKPIDQFKLIIGQFSDAIWGKEGVTGWMFNQKANDGIAVNHGMWFGPGWGSGGDYLGISDGPFHTRYTFFEGFAENGLAMEIKPFDVLGINIAIPFITHSGEESWKAFKAIMAQVDLNLPFGNIALMYDGGYRNVLAFDDDGAFYLYYGNSFGDLSIDFGFSFHLAKNWADHIPPIGIGLGAKYATGAFGIKFRTTVALGGENKTANTKDDTYLNIGLNPYFAINDNLCAFLNMGLGLQAPEKGDASVGFFLNPYLRVGGEWGPSFYVGIKLWSPACVPSATRVVNFDLPIAIMVSF